MAEHERAAVSEAGEDAGTTAGPTSRAEMIASIDDTIVRRFVGLAVHVRGYAPYYVATLALFGFLAFGPRPDAKGGDESPFGTSAAPASGGGAAAVGGGGGRTAGGSATSLSPEAASTLLAGASGSGGLLGGGGSGDGTFSAAGDGLPAGPAIPEAPAAPDFEIDPSDVDYGTDLPDTCTVALPAPAPAVSPSREAEGLQTTAEAAAGMEFPADLAPYAEDAANASGCPNVEETVPVPALPLPGLPV